LRCSSGEFHSLLGGGGARAATAFVRFSALKYWYSHPGDETEDE